MPTILVVDDEPDILEVLKITLEHSGYRVLTATDGAEALEAVQTEIPDAMLLDVGMPHVDGWQVLERIKSSTEADLATVPVVMVTAWTSEEDRLRGGIEGAVHYVGKPFEPAKVVEMLEDLLGPDALPEPELRRQVQRSTLERLARRERGGDADGVGDAAPRVRLTRLDHPHADEHPPEPGLTAASLPRLLESLSSKQRLVVERVMDGVAVGDIAEQLGVSRSNVYAILRRVAKKADLADGRTLIHRLRRLGARPDA